jgi:hypothetical protein
MSKGIMMLEKKEEGRMISHGKEKRDLGAF